MSKRLDGLTYIELAVLRAAPFRIYYGERTPKRRPANKLEQLNYLSKASWIESGGLWYTEYQLTAKGKEALGLESDRQRLARWNAACSRKDGGK